MRILIADGCSEVRAALQLVIKQAGIQVIGEASNGDMLIALMTQGCPDAVILDANLPAPRFCSSAANSGFESLMEQVHAFCPSIYVIALISQPTACQKCLQATAFRFICKYDPPEGLIDVIEQIRSRLVHCGISE
jgi:two-component system, NarL family, response regulator DesR